MDIGELKDLPNEILIKNILPYVDYQYLVLTCQSNMRFQVLCLGSLKRWLEIHYYGKLRLIMNIQEL